MNNYEIMYILDENSISLNNLQEKINKILENNGGKIEIFDNWGIKNFSYLINKKKSGYYFVLIVNTLIENINEFIRICKIEKEILRFLIINIDKEKNYIKSTKFSKTEIKNEKQEKFEKKLNFKKN